MWRTLMCLSLIGVCLGCRDQKTAELKVKVESLKAKLELNQNAVETLLEIGVLMDSIDADRLVINTQMIEGAPVDNYSSRMLSISKYINEAEERIGILENKISSLNGSNESYRPTIQKLKSRLEERNRELLAVQETVKLFRNKNDNLIQTVNLQEESLTDKLNQIKVKEDELFNLEQNVEALLVKSKYDEGEAYYMRAVAVEETAKRTHLAPRKKKDTRKEALELYKRAAFYGKEEAQYKIAELEKKI